MDCTPLPTKGFPLSFVVLRHPFLANRPKVSESVFDANICYF